MGKIWTERQLISFSPPVTVSGEEILERREGHRLDINISHSHRKIKGIQYWKGISEAEKEGLKNFIRVNNLDLDIAGLVVQDMSPFRYKVSHQTPGV